MKYMTDSKFYLKSLDTNNPPAVEFRVWWMPQVPMTPFLYQVPTLEAAQMLCEALADYDLFQLNNKIKPDYPNAGGASWRHPTLTGGEWLDFDPEVPDEYEEVEDAISRLTGPTA
jgi:Superinfection exclusion gene product 17